MGAFCRPQCFEICVTQGGGWPPRSSFFLVGGAIGLGSTISMVSAPPCTQTPTWLMLRLGPDLSPVFSRISCGFLLIFSYFSVHHLNDLQLLENLPELYRENNVNTPTGKRCTAMSKWIKQWAKQDAQWCNCLPTNLSPQNKLRRETVRFTFQAISDSLQSLAGPEGYFRLPRHFPSFLQTLWLKPEGEGTVHQAFPCWCGKAEAGKEVRTGVTTPNDEKYLFFMHFYLV